MGVLADMNPFSSSSVTFAQDPAYLKWYLDYLAAHAPPPPPPPPDTTPAPPPPEPLAPAPTPAPPPAPMPTPEVVDPNIEIMRKRDEARQNALASVSQRFGGPGYGGRRIADTADDRAIEDLLGSQRGKADSFLNNMLARGVVTKTGYDAGVGNVNQQADTARSQFGDVGNAILGGGRQSLDSIIARANSDASNLPSGDTPFDVNKYGAEADKTYNDFIAGLGDAFKARVPNNMFDTSALPATAGAAQGAQNLPYDPTAVASGATSPIKTPEDPYSRKGKSTVSPF